MPHHVPELRKNQLKARVFSAFGFEHKLCRGQIVEIVFDFRLDVLKIAEKLLP